MKNIKFIISAIVVFTLIIASVLIAIKPLNGKVVSITQSGTELYNINLDRIENQIITVEYESRTNTVQIEDGQIRMLEAECPDKTCVHMGWLSSNLPIVCLPNQLVISYSN